MGDYDPDEPLDPDFWRDYFAKHGDSAKQDEREPNPVRPTTER